MFGNSIINSAGMDGHLLPGWAYTWRRGGGVRRAGLEGLCLNQESKFTLHKPALALVPWPGTSGELDLLGYLFSFSLGNHPAFGVPQSKSHLNCSLSSSFRLLPPPPGESYPLVFCPPGGPTEGAGSKTENGDSPRPTVHLDSGL